MAWTKSVKEAGSNKRKPLTAERFRAASQMLAGKARPAVAELTQLDERS